MHTIIKNIACNPANGTRGDFKAVVFERIINVISVKMSDKIKYNRKFMGENSGVIITKNKRSPIPNTELKNFFVLLYLNRVNKTIIAS